MSMADRAAATACSSTPAPPACSPRRPGRAAYVIGDGTITDSSGTLNTSFTALERVAFSTVGSGDFDDIIDASGFVPAHG